MGHGVRKACADSVRLLAAEQNTELSSGLFPTTLRKLYLPPLARRDYKFMRRTAFKGRQRSKTLTFLMPENGALTIFTIWKEPLKHFRYMTLSANR